MTRCIACGTENKAGARFCRQCGILIALPGADTDAELTVARPAPAAPPTVNADDQDTVITRWASQRSAEPVDRVQPPRAKSPPSAAATPPAPALAPALAPTAAPAPAAATRPRGRAWLIGSLAVAALMLIGVFAYVVIGSGMRTAELAVPPKTEPAAKAPPPAVVPPPPAAVALAPPPAEPAPTPEIAAEQVQPATAEPVRAAAPSRGTAAETAQRPGKPAADTARETQRAERARQREAAAAAKRAAAQSALAAQPDLVASANQPPEPKPLSRWDRMAQENSACEAEGFFGRLACKEKLRWKYCPGYWGKVPQCPEGQSQVGGQ